jgi:hypothetical protein
MLIFDFAPALGIMGDSDYVGTFITAFLPVSPTAKASLFVSVETGI